MKIAVICVAYLQNAAGVELQAKYFAGTNTTLYVHVDAKVDDSAYREAASRYSNIRLISERKTIFWGGFNTVRALVAGLKQARDDANYDRYLLITEDTIPLLSQVKFAELMEQNAEFVQTTKTKNPIIVDRYRKFFYFDSHCTSARPSRIVLREVTDEAMSDLERLRLLKLRGKVAIEDLYHGAGWIGLSAPAAEKILRSFEEDVHLRESFEFSAAPEEQYFQTILGDVKGRTLIFNDWSRKPTPYVFKTVEEIRDIDTNGAPFLRKVPLGVPSIEQFVRDLG